MVDGSGTKDDPWQLTTAPGSSSYTMYRDEEDDPPLLVCQVGSTKLTYLLPRSTTCPRGCASRATGCRSVRPTRRSRRAEGSVEAWGRSEDNPVGGWYGQRKGYRGRFGMYVPPLLEALGLVELTHDARNNRVRASADG